MGDFSGAGGGGGGDTGGGGAGSSKGGGDSSNGKGNSGGGSSDTGGGVSAYTPPDNLTTSPGEQAGFQNGGYGTDNGLPSEINNGSSSGSGGGGFSFSDLFSGGSAGGDNGGYNLSGSGPVGGDSGSSPYSVGGVSSFGDAAGISSGDTNALGTTAPSAGAGGGAAAFAAPEGVSGIPSLDSVVNDPSQGNLTGNNGYTAPPVNYDLLQGAQTGAANDYATQQTGISSSGDTTLPATAGANGQPSPSLASVVNPSNYSFGGGSGSSSGSGSSGAGNGLGISGNPLGIGAAAIGLGNTLLNGSKQSAYSPQMNANATTANQTAAQQTAAGTALQQYISTGTLPQGYEDQVQQAAQAAKQQIISNYANRGMPTDPTKNSTLAQELAQVDAKLPAARESLASQLATQGTSMVNTGLQASGISSGLYSSLANLQNSQNQQNSAAIANFASALNGGSKTNSVNLKVG